MSEVLFRQAPANEYGIIVVFSKLVISVVRDGSVLAVQETDEAKDGGLTVGQAQVRSFGKLIEALNSSRQIVDLLDKASSLE